MKLKTNFRQLLVLWTAAAAILAAGSGVAYQALVMPDAVYLETTHCPCIGKRDAPIEIALIEDLLCSGCQTFSEEILPEIYTAYVETGLAKITIIPLAFLRGSKPIGNAALAVYHIAPERFLPYLHELLVERRFDNQGLVDAAKRAGKIDLFRLQECLSSHCYYPELEKNFEMARGVMGRDFGTPALYINGIYTSTASFEAVRTRIEKLSSPKNP